jgi:Uma2 family endonuclease
MREYIDNGAQLAWLIDPEQKRVYIYRPGEAVQELDQPEKISGQPLLSGFELDLREIW